MGVYNFLRNFQELRGARDPGSRAQQVGVCDFSDSRPRKNGCLRFLLLGPNGRHPITPRPIPIVEVAGDRFNKPRGTIPGPSLRDPSGFIPGPARFGSQPRILCWAGGAKGVRINGCPRFSQGRSRLLALGPNRGHPFLPRSIPFGELQTPNHSPAHPLRGSRRGEVQQAERHDPWALPPGPQRIHPRACPLRLPAEDPLLGGGGRKVCESMGVRDFTTQWVSAISSPISKNLGVPAIPVLVRNKWVSATPNPRTNGCLRFPPGR